MLVNLLYPDAESYTITYKATTNYRDTSYAPRDLSRWCVQCHTRYSAGANSGHTASGDAVFGFRHVIEDLKGGCLACHGAHGTTATMQKCSGSVNLPDGSPGIGANDSHLLHTNNRGVCVQCHSGKLTSN